MAISHEDALEQLHYACAAADRHEGLCDENANMCRDIVQNRIAELERAFSDEKQCARLNAECHTREIRALQDMVEAEAEARREAEGKCARLTERLEIKIAALRSEIAAKVSAQRYGVALEDELAGWKRVAVEAAIPLEALRMARPAGDFSPAIRDGIEHAISIIRRAVMGEGLPPAPPDVPSSSKT